MRIPLFSFILLFSISCSESASQEQAVEQVEMPSTLEDYTIKNIILGENCECIVSGTVVYKEGTKDMFRVDYGKGKCDNEAMKTICVDGDCDHEDAITEKIILDCSINSGKPDPNSL